MCLGMFIVIVTAVELRKLWQVYSRRRLLAVYVCQLV